MSLAARGYVLWLINVIFEVALIKIVANGVEEVSLKTLIPGLFRPKKAVIIW